MRIAELNIDGVPAYLQSSSAPSQLHATAPHLSVVRAERTDNHAEAAQVASASVSRCVHRYAHASTVPQLTEAALRQQRCMASVRSCTTPRHGAAPSLAAHAEQLQRAIHGSLRQKF